MRTSVYFPNLNGLRFIAALLVLIHHIEQVKMLFGIRNSWELPFIQIIGKTGVFLFFVLSGFLITYLLLVEERLSGQIAVKKFYFRRILRIWPLYYLIVFLAFFIFPNIPEFQFPGFNKEAVHDNFDRRLLLYLLIFPNIALPILGFVPYAAQLWSIGVEEQFYLIWPITLKCFKRFRCSLLCGVIVFHFTGRALLLNGYLDFIPKVNVLKAFWGLFYIDCMACGGLLAVLLFEKNKLLKLILNKFAFYTAFVVLVVLMLVGFPLPDPNSILYSCLFGVILINLAAHEDLKGLLENRWMNYFGKVSYGLYMYQYVGIVLAVLVGGEFGLQGDFVLYPLSFFFTVALSGLSYMFFESYFLNLKSRCSIVSSGVRV